MTFFVNIGPALHNTIQSNTRISNIPCHLQFMFLRQTDELEIKKVLNEMKGKTSSGPDGVSSLLLKMSTNSLIGPLTILINRCLQQGCFPDLLKVAKVVPIYKEGNKEDFSNYRPISLLPVFGKVLERIIYTRMMKFIDKFKILNDSQFGFRKKRKTIDARACVVEEVRHAKFLKLPSVCVFLDLRKAFDTLDHKILFDKLHRYGFRGPIFSLLSSFLQNRYQFLQVENHKSSLRSVACGVPQGSVLGPLLFLLYINDLPDVANSNITLFADDTNIFEKVVNGNQDTLTETLSKVDNWMKSNKLKCNLDKSKAIIFNKSSESDLHLGSLVIEMKHNLKYLGVIIDDSLCFKDNVAKIKQKLNFCHHTVRRCRDLLTESQLLVYYKLHVNPLIQYGVLIYGCTSFSILSPIYPLQ